MNIQTEGYDAYVEVIAKGLTPMFSLGMRLCPYMIGDDRRKDWMAGWNKAREDV